MTVEKRHKYIFRIFMYTTVSFCLRCNHLTKKEYLSIFSPFSWIVSKNPQPLVPCAISYGQILWRISVVRRMQNIFRIIQSGGAHTSTGKQKCFYHLTKGVFTCSILASIVTILIIIVIILTSIDPILEKCVHLQVQYSRVL